MLHISNAWTLHDDIPMDAGILTKGLRKAVHALYQSRGLDANTYIKGNQDQDHECDNQLEQEETQRHHPCEYEREDSILPTGSPSAWMMPIPRYLQAPKTPSSDFSPQQATTHQTNTLISNTERPTTHHTNTPGPFCSSTPIQRYQPYQVPIQRLPLTPGRDFTLWALRKKALVTQRTVYSPSDYLLDS